MQPKDLILKYHKDQLTPAEMLELQDWLHASEANRKFFNKMSDPEYIKDKLMLRQRVNKQAEWEKVQEAISRDENGEPVHKDETKQIGWRRIGITAASIMVISAGISLLIIYRQPSKTSSPASVGAHLRANDPPPGSNKATLILSDGSTITLDSTGKGTIALQGNARISKPASGQLTYNKLNDKPGNIVYNTLTTPRSAQYRVTLPDGTKVWLNSVSSLRFPSAFVGKTREVILTGEAYFEIAPNASAPFTVKVDNGRDTLTAIALGTSFNIMAYENEDNIATTLLTGKVDIEKNGALHILKPGQQAQLTADGMLHIDTDSSAGKVAAWKDGTFYFEKADIQSVMRTLERWYDVTVEYKGPISHHYKFVGPVSRSINLSQVLDILKGNDVHLEIEGKKIIVTP
ncbi:MAG TPA: FecR domain-containing protein [Puia sp.]|nr:FecR domain-containing protein [Puia sp.]